MNTDLQIYGARDDIKELGYRLQKMMPSAQSFTADEALAVAQIANAHKLDPFNGEVWGIKNYDGKWYGVMVGIKGLRKCARRAAAEENSSYWLEFRLVEAKKYQAEQQGAVVYECVLRDAATMQAYGQAINALTKSGVPYKEAVEMVGPAPAVTGIGIAWPAEKSKMSLHQRAKKRAEADALKVRYDVDFGSGVTVTVEEQGDTVDALPVENLPDDFDQGVDVDYPAEPERSELQNLSELGFDADEPPIKQAKPRLEGDDTMLVTVLAAETLNKLVEMELFDAPQAAAQVASRLFNKTQKAPFKKIVEMSRAYRGHKDGGKSTDDAIEAVLAG